LLKPSTILLEYKYELPAMSKIAISIGNAMKSNILVLIFIKILQSIVFLSPKVCHNIFHIISAPFFWVNQV